MIRRFGMGLAGSLVLTLALSGTSLAATSAMQATILRQVCTYNGGANGLGYVLLRVKVREVGMSGVNYFVIKSSAQEPLTGSGWDTSYRWPKETSTNFADNGVNHYRVVERRIDFNGFVFGRIQMKVQFWSNSQGKLYTRTVNGDTC